MVNKERTMLVRIKLLSLGDEGVGSLLSAIRPKVIELRQRVTPTIKLMAMVSARGHSPSR